MCITAAMESPDSDMMMALCAYEISHLYPKPQLVCISTSGFVALYQKAAVAVDFDLRIFIHMSFCVSLANFVVNWG